MDREFQKAVECIERAEKLAPPGSYHHDLYVKAALMSSWPAIKGYAEAQRRANGGKECGGP